MVFFLRKLAVGLFLSSFFFLMQAQAGIVEPIYKQLKDPTTYSKIPDYGAGIELSATF